MGQSLTHFFAGRPPDGPRSDGEGRSVSGRRGAIRWKVNWIKGFRVPAGLVEGRGGLARGGAVRESRRGESLFAIIFSSAGRRWNGATVLHRNSLDQLLIGRASRSARILHSAAGGPEFVAIAAPLAIRPPALIASDRHIERRFDARERTSAGTLRACPRRRAPLGSIRPRQLASEHVCSCPSHLSRPPYVSGSAY